MARSSPRKRQVVSYNEDHDEDVKPVSKPAPRRTVSVHTGAISKAVKRKAEPEPENEAPAPATKTTKKRKTKAKDEDAMPLADRTAMPSLKKAMYIGAHVSAAGGLCPYPD